MMGTITEKLTYLGATKEAIKDAIVAKGQSVSSTDTFRSYADKISNIETGSTPTISVSSSGLITATSGNFSATKQLSTQAAQSITPGTSKKTISSGKYLTGTQTIIGDSDLISSNIKSGVTIFNVAGSCTPLNVQTDILTSGDIKLAASGITITLSKSGASNSVANIALNFQRSDGVDGVIVPISSSRVMGYMLDTNGTTRICGSGSLSLYGQYAYIEFNTSSGMYDAFTTFDESDLHYGAITYTYPV